MTMPGAAYLSLEEELNNSIISLSWAFGIWDGCHPPAVTNLGFLLPTHLALDSPVLQ